MTLAELNFYERTPKLIAELVQKVADLTNKVEELNKTIETLKK